MSLFNLVKSTCLILLLLLSAQSTSVGATDQMNIKRKVDCKDRPIRVAYYQMGGFQHNGVGLDVDMMKEIEKRTGCKFTYTVFPRATIWQMLEDGDIDMATSAIPTPEREKFAWFSIYIKQKNVMLFHKSVPPGVNSIEDFSANPKLRFGMVKSFKHGAAYDDLVAGMVKAGRVTTVEDQPSLFRGLVEGKYDGILAFPINFNKFLREYGMLGTVRMSDYVGDDHMTPLGFVFSKKHFTHDDIESWGAEVYEMRKSGLLLRLYLPYLKLYEAEKAVKF